MENIAKDGEQKFIAIGLDLTRNLVAVVYTYRGGPVQVSNTWRKSRLKRYVRFSFEYYLLKP